MMKQSDSIRVLNIQILNIDSETLLKTYNSGCIFTPNVDHVVLLQQDKEFYRVYKSAEYIILDSQVIYLLWKLRKKSFKEKIAGADFFPEFCKYHYRNENIKLFILGGMDGVAEQIRNFLNLQSGRSMVVGTYAPPINYENNEVEQNIIIYKINATDANVLVVALGTPKQEKWIYNNKKYLPKVTMYMGIGATLDFMMGTQKRAPRWMQNIGFEWLFRLTHDPKRLFARYVIRDIHFFYYLIKDVLKIYRNPFEE